MKPPSGRGDPRLERGADALFRDPPRVRGSGGGEDLGQLGDGSRRGRPTASPMSASRRSLRSRTSWPAARRRSSPSIPRRATDLLPPGPARLRHGAADVRLRPVGRSGARLARRYAIELAPVGFRQTLLALERAIPKVVELPAHAHARLRRPVPGGPDRSDAHLASGACQAAGRGRPGAPDPPHWLATESLRLIALTGYRFAVDPARGRADHPASRHHGAHRQRAAQLPGRA